MLMFISILVDIFQSKHDLGYTLGTNEQVVVPDDSYLFTDFASASF